jgi:hypothetical protein
MGSRGSPKRPAAALDEAQFLRQQAQQALWNWPHATSLMALIPAPGRGNTPG